MVEPVPVRPASPVYSEVSESSESDEGAVAALDEEVETSFFELEPEDFRKDGQQLPEQLNDNAPAAQLNAMQLAQMMAIMLAQYMQVLAATA